MEKAGIPTPAFSPSFFQIKNMSKNIQKLFIILIIILCLLSVGVASIIQINKTHNKSLPVNTKYNNVNNNSPVKEIKTTEGIEFLYQNEELNFNAILPESFSYYGTSEKNLTVSAAENVVIFLPAGGAEPAPDIFQIMVDIRPDQEGKSIESWAEGHPLVPDQISLQKTKISGREALTISGEKAIRQFEITTDSLANELYYSSVVYVIHSDKLYILQARAKNKEQYNQYGLAFNQFINSFFFLN